MSAASTGRTRSKAVADPPTMVVSVPCSASAVLPDTGASRKSAPCRWASAAISRAAFGPIVLMSTATQPARHPASSPSGPHQTARAAAPSESMVMMTSLAAASSPGEPATRTSRSASGPPGWRSGSRP